LEKTNRQTPGKTQPRDCRAVCGVQSNGDKILKLSNMKKKVAAQEKLNRILAERPAFK